MPQKGRYLLFLLTTYFNLAKESFSSSIQIIIFQIIIFQILIFQAQQAGPDILSLNNQPP